MRPGGPILANQMRTGARQCVGLRALRPLQADHIARLIAPDHAINDRFGQIDIGGVSYDAYITWRIRCASI
jgi:hypothetical protein